MKKEKLGVILILCVIAILGTYINYRPSIEEISITSVEITDAKTHKSKIFNNQFILNNFSNNFYMYSKNFRPMVINLDKSYDSVMYIERIDGSFIPIMIQDDCLKIKNKWYKTDGEFIDYTYKFFEEYKYELLDNNDSKGFLYYNIDN